LLFDLSVIVERMKTTCEEVNFMFPDFSKYPMASNNNCLVDANQSLLGFGMNSSNSMAMSQQTTVDTSSMMGLQSSNINMAQQEALLANLKALLPWLDLSGSVPAGSLPVETKVEVPSSPLTDEEVSDLDILHCLDVAIFEEFPLGPGIPVLPAKSISKLPGTEVVTFGEEAQRPSGGKRCTVPGCMKAAQTKGRCKGHGGGNRCKYPSCPKSSQTGGLCRLHGGGKKCSAEGCGKGAQRDGLCATHGGMRKCSMDGCTKNDRGGGFCAQHGGGKRCAVDGCLRPSRRKGLCTFHVRSMTAFTYPATV